MKIASEYSAAFDVKKLSRYAVKNITRICNEIGPRKPGSPEELKAQELMAKDLKNSCENVEKIRNLCSHLPSDGTGRYVSE